MSGVGGSRIALRQREFPPSRNSGRRRPQHELDEQDHHQQRRVPAGAPWQRQRQR